MTNVRAIIFDIYGVLGLNGWQAFKLRHFAAHPESWDALQDLGRRVDAGEVESQKLVEAVALAAGVTEEEVAAMLDDTVANEPLVDFIRTLRPAYKIGVLSNASRDDVTALIFTDEERALFDAVVTSYHVGLTKPDPKIFLLVCQQLGVEPKECLYVDDQQRHVDAAASLGMRTVLYTSVPQVTADVKAALEP